MKKVICTVINDLTYDQRMHRICSSLADNGYEVVLVGRHLEHSKPLPKQKFEQKRLKCFVNKGKLFYLEYNLRLLFYLLFHGFDAVNSVDLDTLLAGYWAAKVKGKPCIFDAHEYFQEVPEVVTRPLTQKIWETLAWWIIPKLDHCYTVSPGLAAIFSKKYHVKFHTILNVPRKTSANRSTGSPSPTSGRKIILYQGALNEGRAIELAIKAVNDVEDVELWLAGEGDLSCQLRQLSESMGLSGKIKFLGYMGPDELKQLTPKAFLGYNLLENKGLSYYHSLANKFFDYMHAGIPVINPAFPEYENINSEFEVSYIVDPATIDNLVLTIRKAISDQDRHNYLKNNCLKASEIFTWENEQEKLLSIYQKALQ